jgi:hypothetical protein
MTRFDPAVMGTIDPRLQVGEDKMDHRQVLFRLLRVSPERERVVPIANLAKTAVSLPTAGTDDRARRYGILDECGECFGVATRKRNIGLCGAGDNAEPEAARISQFLGRNAAFVGILPFRGAVRARTSTAPTTVV